MNSTCSIKKRLEAVLSLAEYLDSQYEGVFDIHDDLQFTASPSRGVVVKALNAIEKDQLLLLVPNKARMNYVNCTEGNENLQKVMKAIYERSNATIAEIESLDITITALLMHMLVLSSQKSEGDQDEKCKYASKVTATWPSREEIAKTSVHGWSKEEMEGLEGTYAEFLILLGMQADKKIFNSVILPCIQEANMESDFFAPGDNTHEERYQAFLYAFYIAHSRCHEGEAMISADLIPLIDLVNGLPSITQTTTTNQHQTWGGINVALFRHDVMDSTGNIHKCTALKSIQDISAGKELIISYGELPPSACLYKYGFCPDVYLKQDGKHSFLPDVVNLWFPKSLAPKSQGAIECLKSMSYPTTPEELEATKFMLSPLELLKWQEPLRGLGQELQRYGHNEPEQFKNLRQFIMLGHLATEEQVKHFSKHQRLTGQFRLEEMGKLILRVIDYNLANLFNADMTNVMEVEATENNQESGSRIRDITICRVMYRETLAQWRHAVCRYFALFSAADNNEDLRKMFELDISEVAFPDCLKTDGCSVSGKTINVKKCGRCKAVSYSCKEHQQLHWRLHKPVCMPADYQNKITEVKDDDDAPKTK